MVDEPGMCSDCTKRACITALNASGKIYSPKTAIDAYVKWPIMHVGNGDPVVIAAYSIIGEYVGDNVAFPEEINDLMRCRSLVMESVFVLNSPRDVRSIIDTIDDRLFTNHNIIVCKMCAAVLDGSKKISRVCDACMHVNQSSFLNAPMLLSSSIVRSTKIIRPIAMIISYYVLDEWAP
jgi:hypothetical protein